MNELKSELINKDEDICIRLRLVYIDDDEVVKALRVYGFKYTRYYNAWEKVVTGPDAWMISEQMVARFEAYAECIYINDNIVDTVPPPESYDDEATKRIKIDRIKEIMEEFSEWTASDGGLTVAASDALHLANNAIKHIAAGKPRREWCPDRFCWDCRLTGPEQDICDIVKEY